MLAVVRSHRNASAKEILTAMYRASREQQRPSGRRHSRRRVEGSLSFTRKKQRKSRSRVVVRPSLRRHRDIEAARVETRLLRDRRANVGDVVPIPNEVVGGERIISRLDSVCSGVPVSRSPRLDLWQ